MSETRPLQCESDREACDHTLGLFVGRPLTGKVEVWKGVQKTFSYSRCAMRSPMELRRLCYLAIAAAKKKTDPGTKRAIAAGAFMLAQQAEVMERRMD